MVTPYSLRIILASCRIVYPVARQGGPAAWDSGRKNAFDTENLSILTPLTRARRPCHDRATQNYASPYSGGGIP
jgi:hypothetical protein